MLSFVALSSFMVNSCGKIPIKGCMDRNSPDYNPSADEDNGSCRYRYAGNVRVDAFPANNTANSPATPWDPLDGPDMYFVFKKATSTSWDYSTATNQDVQYFTELTNSSSNIQFTNEEWRYELRDDDGTGTYEVMASGTFNPLQAENVSILTLSTGTTTIYFYFNLN